MSILNIIDLRRHLGMKTAAQIAAELSYIGVPFKLQSNGNPITTTEAFNAAIMRPLKTQADHPDKQPTIKVL
jgi:hypothetical protein